jgi:hypothetical protein
MGYVNISRISTVIGEAFRSPSQSIASSDGIFEVPVLDDIVHSATRRLRDPMYRG